MPETDGQQRDALLAIEGHLAERGVQKQDLHAAIYAMSALQAALTGRVDDMPLWVNTSIKNLSEVLERLDDSAKKLGTPRWLKDPVELPKDER